MSTSSEPSGMPRGPARVAAAVCVVEALALLGAVAASLVPGPEGAGSWGSVSVPVVATFVLFAVCLIVLARGWLRGRAWARTPTVVWNVLLLLTALTLRSTWGTAPALVLVALACAGLAAALYAHALDPRDSRAQG